MRVVGLWGFRVWKLWGLGFEGWGWGLGYVGLGLPLLRFLFWAWVQLASCLSLL